MNNWDKVKEELDITDITSHGIKNAICKAILRVKQKDYCDMSSESCIICYKWLEEEYKPQILTGKEREYLSAVIKPFRSETGYIIKHKNTLGEFIVIWTGYDIAELPRFEKGKYYKGMETEKRYSLEELGL